MDVTLRTVPSAGARHPFETFLLLNNVEGFEAGLYRYIATKHKLQALEVTADIQDEIVKACLGQEFLKTSAATFIWVADSYRTRWRYGERGVRYLFLDAAMSARTSICRFRHRRRSLRHGAFTTMSEQPHGLDGSNPS